MSLLSYGIVDISKIAIPVLTTLETVRVCLPTIVEAARGRVQRSDCDQRLAEWSETAVRLAEIDVRVRGLEHIEPEHTYVVMSNHQSSYDIFVIMHAFPRTLRMVSKIEMFRVPIVGDAMRAAEFVPLDRGDIAKARKGLDYARAKLESGVNVWISPEGTRSPDGALLPFKKGGFMLALQTKARILPCTVVGTRDVLRSKGYEVNRGQTVDVVFHPPIETAKYGFMRRADLMRDVRDSIESALPHGMRASSQT